MFWLEKSTPAKASGRIWSFLRPKQSKSPWKHHPVAQPFAWQTTKPPQTRAEDARKIQQQLKTHPQIWIGKAEQPKSVSPLNSALVFCTLQHEFLCGMDEFIQSSLAGWIPGLYGFFSPLVGLKQRISINVHLVKLEETSVGLNKICFNSGGIFLWLFLLFCFLHFQRCVNIFFIYFYICHYHCKLPATLKFGNMYTHNLILNNLLYLYKNLINLILF